MKRLTVSFFLFIFLGCPVLAQTEWSIKGNQDGFRISEALIGKLNKMIKDGKINLDEMNKDLSFRKDKDKIRELHLLNNTEYMYIPSYTGVKEIGMKVLETYQLSTTEDKFIFIRFVPEGNQYPLPFRLEAVYFDGKKKRIEGKKLGKVIEIWKMELKVEYRNEIQDYVVGITDRKE